ncbi:IS1595 family transposase [uncultured Jatrophihabitans sp.]|uniref:IS1595 family transposase n=1 Tax=uncultured Jatrophihabitans sp. TaxID=1610747 RepID=UPI0035CBF535
MQQEFSLPKLATLVPDEESAYRFLEQLRWTDGTPDACPHCESTRKFYFLTPKDGTEGRTTRTGANTQRRLWKCAECRKKFSVLTGTPMHGTKLSIRTWVMVTFEVVASKNSVSAWEISRKYGIHNESAWFLLHRIREAMKLDPVAGLLGGAVQVDETRIGGDPKNRHASDPREAARKARPGRDGYSASDKQPVAALVHYETRSVHAVAVPDVTGASLLPAIEHVMDLKRTHLHTDGGSGYKNIAGQFRAHEYVDHKAGQYTRGNVSTNLVEGFFSQLKRSIDGTHHFVSVDHLDRYLTQFAFLYTHCRSTDSQRMRLLFGNMTGRRLAYKPLIGA